MREAIAQYVEREEKREALKGDALRAWEDYQRTGLHLTFEEADAWLEKLEAGAEDFTNHFMGVGGIPYAHLCHGIGK